MPKTNYVKWQPSHEEKRRAKLVRAEYNRAVQELDLFLEHELFLLRCRLCCVTAF